MWDPVYHVFSIRCGECAPRVWASSAHAQLARAMTWVERSPSAQQHCDLSLLFRTRECMRARVNARTLLTQTAAYSRACPRRPIPRTFSELDECQRTGEDCSPQFDNCHPLPFARHRRKAWSRVHSMMCVECIINIYEAFNCARDALVWIVFRSV